MSEEETGKEIFVFPDTNFFIHAKLFTEIDWQLVFPDENFQLSIIIPHVVLQEIDRLKYSNRTNTKKRARKIISKFNKLQASSESKKGVNVEFSLFPVRWESLNLDLQEKLEKNESDHQLIGEILNFKEKNYGKEIYFITGDLVPFFIAKELKINTIKWNNEEYAEILHETRVYKKQAPDLEICFENGDNKIKIDVPLEPPKLMSADIYDERSSEIFKAVNNLNDSKSKEMISTLTNNLIKEKNEFYEEVIEYNKKIVAYNNYQPIKIVLKNNGNIPYTDIDINIKCITEKSIEIKNKEDVVKPMKPSINSLVDFVSLFLKKKDNSKSNFEFNKITKVAREKNNCYTFGCSINKLKHNLSIRFSPIMINILEDVKTNKIVLNCSFTHNEPGTIKQQNLEILINKVIRAS